MQDASSKICALHTTNKEIIERIQSQKEITWYTYSEEWASDGSAGYNIVEKKHSIPAKTFLAKWSIEISLEHNVWAPSPELHEELSSPKLTWTSIRHLNDAMFEQVKKLSNLLDPNPDNNDAETALRKYLRNFESLQVALGNLEGSVMNQPSQKSTLNAKVAHVNSALSEVRDFLATLDSNRSLTESIIIDLNEETILQEWYCPNGALRLLYRGSRDGREAADFHRLCDNQGPTVTVIRSDDRSVFGGFTENVWGEHFGGYRSGINDSTSLFFLRKPRKEPPRRFFLRNRSCATFSSPSYGPSFGHSPCLCLFTNRYDSPILSGLWNHDDSFAELENVEITDHDLFSIDDIEVFAVDFN